MSPWRRLWNTPFPLVLLVVGAVAGITLGVFFLVPHPDEEIPAQEVGMNDIRTFNVTVEGRTVPCIIASTGRRSGGVALSCDWGSP